MEPDQTSLRYLQLKDAFRRMVALGVDATDKQVGRTTIVAVIETPYPELNILYVPHRRRFGR
jgi:hypothetical protein